LKDVASAAAAIAKVSGRKFAGNMVTAEYFSEDRFMAEEFGDSAGDSAGDRAGGAGPEAAAPQRQGGGRATRSRSNSTAVSAPVPVPAASDLLADLEEMD
jgi:hypothetical protein